MILAVLAIILSHLRFSQHRANYTQNTARGVSVFLITRRVYKRIHSGIEKNEKFCGCLVNELYPFRGLQVILNNILSGKWKPADTQCRHHQHGGDGSVDTRLGLEFLDSGFIHTCQPSLRRLFHVLLGD